MGLGAAAVGVAAAGVGASLYSGMNSADAAKSAANTQAAAANNASATQLGMFNTTQQNLAPYMTAGGNALAQLQAQLGLTGTGATGVPGATSPLALPTYGSTINGMTGPQNYGAAQYQQSPGYQFQMDQGLGAISNAASAQGGVQSGNTLKALTTYGQGLANQDYQQAYQNYVANYGNAYNSASANANTSFNRLQTVTGSGQNAAAGLGALSSQTAGQVGNNIIGAGNATAAGTVGAANATTGAVNSGVNNLVQLAYLYGMNPSTSGASTGGINWYGNAPPTDTSGIFNMTYGGL